MRRGDIITVAMQGDYGKPRPALVIQSDALADSESVLVVLFTSVIRDASFYRLTVDPSEKNGLNAISQIMIDKIVACPRAKCGPVMGHLEKPSMFALNNLLSVMIGLAD